MVALLRNVIPGLFRAFSIFLGLLVLRILQLPIFVLFTRLKESFFF